MSISRETPLSGERAENIEPSADFIEKLRAIDQELRAEAGDLVLFGLFERRDAPAGWDLLVAADWVDPNVPDAVAYVASKLQQRLTPDELVFVAGVVTLPSSHPFVRQLLTGTIAVPGGLVQVGNSTFNGIHIEHAWIFTANVNGRSRFQPPPYVASQKVSTKAKSARAQKPGAKRKG